MLLAEWCLHIALRVLDPKHKDGESLLVMIKMYIRLIHIRKKYDSRN